MKRVLILAALGALASSSAVVAQEVSVERGKLVSITSGCHDCHTAGYNESGGKIDPEAALKGVPLGWQGPWGTTYAVNLRLEIKDMDEDGFVEYAKTFDAKPPMPFYNVHAMPESDLRSLYQYIKSLGDPGDPMPEALPPGEAPTTPYIVMAPPMMPN
ncbi:MULTISPECIES: c-type cytochrome [Thioclava]|uniref:c-type cytochrome n=1 Tax=Thioclava TaxID=285107 RepID=UPI000C4E3822|nr:MULTISPECIES: c-type cytochrome [Thioclava]MAQ39051.1 cytochrome C [Thioclava sp.]|tara:strand:- start:159 stop:632 length:474 start_codon:yes stop_codon:yes gene_type:complete